MFIKLFTFDVQFIFHLDISGKNSSNEHPENNPNKELTLLIFHLEMSGNEIKDEHHPQNNNDIFLALLIFQPEISGKYFKDEHSKNKKLILCTLSILHLEILGIFFNE